MNRLLIRRSCLRTKRASDLLLNLSAEFERRRNAVERFQRATGSADHDRAEAEHPGVAQLIDRGALTSIAQLDYARAGDDTPVGADQADRDPVLAWRLIRQIERDRA